MPCREARGVEEHQASLDWQECNQQGREQRKERDRRADRHHVHAQQRPAEPKQLSGGVG